jgi:hypothetical protein
MSTTIRKILLATALAAALPGATALAEGMRVVRDAQTGQLRAPNNEELRAMLAAEKAERAARRARGEDSGMPEETVVRIHADGMKSALLGEDQLVQVVAERDADGKLVVKHANPADEHVAPATELPTE